jgi:hypothetical protein
MNWIDPERPLHGDFASDTDRLLVAALRHSRSAEIDGFAVVQPRIGQQRSG